MSSPRLTRDEITATQDESLARLIPVAARAPFWRRKFDDAGVDPASVRTAADLARLPTTTKEELAADHAANPDYGTTPTEPLAAYTRFHQTSGTTGSPMRWPDTPAGWDWVVGRWETIFGLTGTPTGEPVFFPFSFGPFLGFWSAFEAAARRGNLAVPAGGLGTEARLRMLAHVGATTVCCTPTYALRMAEVAAAEGLPLADLPVARLIVAGEPGGGIEATRGRIEAAWGADCFDHWGMTEVGPLATAVAGDKAGLSVLEEACVAEILRTDADGPVPEGEVGELTITNVGRVGSPVIRYRTGDLVRATVGGHPTGDGRLRLDGGILGRADDMVVVRGNNVFPSAIEAVVRRFAEVAEYRIVVSETGSLNDLAVEIEPAAETGRFEDLVARVGDALRRAMNFRLDVSAVEPGSLPRFEMKGKRVVRR